MQYSNVIPGRFVSRPNRFLAQVKTADGVQTCHVKNTGRCAELLLPGAPNTPGAIPVLTFIWNTAGAGVLQR